MDIYILHLWSFGVGSTFLQFRFQALSLSASLFFCYPLPLSSPSTLLWVNFFEPLRSEKAEQNPNPNNTLLVIGFKGFDFVSDSIICLVGWLRKKEKEKMLQLFFTVAFSAAPLTLYVPPIRSLNLFVEAMEDMVRESRTYTTRAYPRLRVAWSRILNCIFCNTR